VTSAGRTHVRWFPVLALIAFGTLLNYLDRTVLGIAAPSLSRDLGLSAATTGIVFSAFSWSYALLQIPGGIFLDRFGPRLTYVVAVVGWSAFTAAMGIVNSLATIVVARIGVGTFEAPCFPANSRILASWFPQQERARANAIYAVGQYAGIGFLSVPLFWITQAFGWRVLFFVVGGIGIAFGAVWWRLYRAPAQSTTVNRAELDHIEAGGGGDYLGQPLRFRWRNVIALLRHRQIVGASIGQFGGNSTQVFFLTWFPTYLVTARKMTFLTAGAVAAIPYVAASIGGLIGGFTSDTLLKRTGSANLARKLPIVSGMLLASCIVAANYVPANDNVTVIAILSLAFFGQGMTNLGWTVISDVAPKKLIGLTGGIFNFSANLAGIVTPIVIGVTYGITGSFVGPLVYIAIVALIGAFSYSIVLGDIHRLEVDTDDPETSVVAPQRVGGDGGHGLLTRSHEGHGDARRAHR
jgi:MFS transporter, ACS family, D-galactonate transporter